MDTKIEIKELDIYDFDKTMVPFDSGAKFCAFCMLHYPAVWLYTPLMFVAVIRYIFNRDLTKMKSLVFRYIKAIPLEKAVKKFWDSNEKFLFDWAKKENRERYSVMISAGPDFLIGEIAKRIEIDDFISTVHDKNGVILGNNCHDREKVRLFKEKYPCAKVINVYSDSIENDRYIFSLGDNCYHSVNGNRIKFEYDKMYN